MRDQIVELTKYAWLFRYPGDVDGPSLADGAGVRNKVRGFEGRRRDAKLQAKTPAPRKQPNVGQTTKNDGPPHGKVVVAREEIDL
ncbi:MAG: hypothetical protein ACLQVN_10640 [Bryobacteraceae bacterium]